MDIRELVNKDGPTQNYEIFLVFTCNVHKSMILIPNWLDDNNTSGFVVH